MPIDVFNISDPFDRMNLFPRSRAQAAYPALDDADTESQISKLTRGTLSGLGYVGSTLDKLTGARALRGALGGKPRELLSLIPGSDVAGLTHEEDTVHGEDLLRSAGYDPSQGNWFERNLVGPGVEIALDPSTYLGGVGALTRAGKLAAKTGTGTRGLLAGVQAGQRSLHPILAAAEKVVPGTQARAVAGLQGVGRAAQAANVGLRRIPGAGPIPSVASVEDFLSGAASAAETGRRSLFEKSAGWVPRREIQTSFRNVKHEADLAGERHIRGLETELYPEKEGLGKTAGMAPEALDRWLNQHRESVPTDFVGPHLPGTEDRLRTFGDRLVELGRHEPQAIEAAAGVHTPLLNDEFAGYGLQHRYSPAGQKRGLFDLVQSAFGGKAKLLPTTHGSMIRRKDALRNWAGGRVAIEDLMVPQYAGREPTLPRRQITQELLRDQLDRVGAGAGGVPLSPERLRELQGRSVAMRRWLATVPAANIEGGIPGAQRIPFMDPDPIATTLLRQKRARDVAGSANTVYDVIGRNAIPANPASDAVGIPEVLARSRLTNEGGMTRALEALGYDVDAELAERAGMLEEGETFDPLKAMRELLDQHALPNPTARGATRLLNRWQVPEELQPWLAVSDAAQNLFKTGTYSIWPGSLMRNIGSGVEENALMAGLPPDPRRYRSVTQGLEGSPMVTGVPGHGPLTPELQRNDLVRRAYIQGVIGRPQGEIAERVGMAPPTAGVRNPLGARETVAQIAGQLPQSIAQKAAWNNLGLGGLGDLGTVGRQLGTKAEDTLRMTEFQHLLQQGWSDVEAARRVAETHFDYNDLAPFESAVMKRLIPFYTYPRKNLPKQISRALQSPTMTGGPIRFSGMNQEEEGGYVPEYLRSGLAMPIGEVEPGSARYLSALGLPLEEAFGRLKIGQSLPETVAKTGEAALGMLRPGLRLPLEMTTGRQFFTGRDLKDLHVGNLENLVTGGNETTGRMLSEVLGATPASRMLSTVNRAIDPRKYAGGPASAAVAELVPFLSGLRVSDVETEKWKAIDARNQLERQMQQSQHIRESKDYFADKTARTTGQVTEEEALALRTYAALKARAKEAADEKKRVGVRIGGG